MDLAAIDLLLGAASAALAFRRCRLVSAFKEEGGAYDAGAARAISHGLLSRARP